VGLIFAILADRVTGKNPTLQETMRSAYHFGTNSNRTDSVPEPEPIGAETFDESRSWSQNMKFLVRVIINWYINHYLYN
jgi:hypothetical protein